jgi:hypothetical protein
MIGDCDLVRALSMGRERERSITNCCVLLLFLLRLRGEVRGQGGEGNEAREGRRGLGKRRERESSERLGNGLSTSKGRAGLQEEGEELEERLSLAIVPFSCVLLWSHLS